MRFLLHPQVLLIVAGILAQMAALATLFRRGLAPAYPGLVAFTAIGATRSAWLVYCGTQSTTGYHDAWIATRWIPLATTAVLVLDEFRVMASHFKNVNRFATFLFAAYGAIGAITAWSLSGIGSEWSALVSPMVRDKKNYTAAGVVLLGLSRAWFFSSPSVRMRPNCYRIVDITFGYLVVEWWCLLALSAFGRRAEWANVIIGALPLLTSIAWIALINPAGERWEPPSPLGVEAVEAATDELLRIAAAIRPGRTRGNGVATRADNDFL